MQPHRQKIVELVRASGGATRPVLADALGLSLPTVSIAVRALLDEGILIEGEYLRSSGGRRARVLNVNPAFLRSVGLSVSTSAVRGILADLSGKVLHEKCFEWCGPLSRDAVLQRLYEAVQTLLDFTESAPAGIGVGITGPVRHAEGVSLRFPYVDDWSEVPVAELVRKRFGMDVFVDNDVNASTLAEMRFGKGRGIRNFLYVFAGRGIGLGIVIEGALHRGASGNAGALGHVALGEGGVLCHCGNYGCLETVAGPEALVSEVRHAIASGARSAVEVAEGGEVTIGEVVRAAEAGDRLAENVLVRAVEYTGRMIANAANLFDPERIILGGLLSTLSERLLAPLVRAFDSGVLPGIAPAIEIEVSGLGAVAGALGAAEMVFQNHIADLANLRST